MPFHIYGALFNPSDLAMLKIVFDRLCAERRLAAKDKDQREELAAEVFFLFQGGVVSENALWRALSRRRSAGDWSTTQRATTEEATNPSEP